MLNLTPVLRPGEVAELLRNQPNVRLLDVRTPAEYTSAHIAGAYNVPLDTLHEHAREIRANVTDPIVLVCQSGQRARRAEDSLKAAGMHNLHVLDGGVNGWVAAGLAVRRGTKKMSLERQVRIVAGTVAGAGGLLAALVHPAFGFVPAFVGGGLAFAGVTDTCGMAMVLARLPYNRTAACDVGAMVRALSDGRAPAIPATGLGGTPPTCCN
jgi:rhodanese-related sulfurtransferase